MLLSFCPFILYDEKMCYFLIFSDSKLNFFFLFFHIDK